MTMRTPEEDRVIYQKPLSLEKYPRVTREEIDQANRELARGVDSLEASDLLDRASKAGQYLRRVTYFPAGSEFARAQLTTDVGFSVKYKLSDDMQTVLSVETPKDPELNIIVKPVASAKSPLGRALLGVAHPLA